MKHITEQLDDFIDSPVSNKWLNDGILSVYVRKGYHVYDGMILNTLDIANISTISEQYQGKGYFKTFMKKAESIGKPIWVECIHNPLLSRMLVKHGYTIFNNGGIHAIKFVM